MARTLLATVLPGCPVERFARLGAGLLQAASDDSRPRLLVAELTGEAILLGRHQRASSALEREAVQGSSLSVCRRSGGGQAILAGEGRIGVYLALPKSNALLDTPIPPDRVLNRYVRGLLAGLTRAGAGSGAHYFGRDFISSESRKLAVISQDGLTGGAVLFEAIVGIQESLDLPPSFRGYPVHSDPRAEGPPAVTLSELWRSPHSFEEITGHIVEGYQRIHDATVEISPETELREATVHPAVWEEEEGWEESGVADIAIGFAEALIRLDGDKVAAARFRGDFISPAFAVRGLEEEVVGAPLDFEKLGALVDAAFKRPGAAILGVRGLRIFPDAVLAAAGRH